MTEFGGIRGAGLGLRRAHLSEIANVTTAHAEFFEVAPENWMKIGGALGRQFRAITESRTVIAHGLSLSLGGLSPIDESFLLELKAFLNLHQIPLYSEHLSYCSDEGHLYDLMPIPFTAEAVSHVAGRIRQTQAVLERTIAIENVSYYAAPGQDMSELEFLCAVLDEADCGLLLDVNNIYVNSINHGYDAEAFLDAIPGERIIYVHMAGHYVEAEDLLIDTHGAPVVDPVWHLLDRAYARFGVKPTLLERDFNLPPIQELLAEVAEIRRLQKAHSVRVMADG